MVVATPVIGDGLAFVTAGYPPVRPVYAVRPGQRGDLSLPKGEHTSKAVAWSHARGGTYIPSPILYRGILYTCNNNGVLTAYRAETGEQLSIIRLSAAGSLLFRLSGRGRRQALFRERDGRRLHSARRPRAGAPRRPADGRRQ